MKLCMNNLPIALQAQSQALGLCIEAFAKVLPIRRVLLFGSHARGDSAPDSDVDLCIVADGAENQLEAARLLRRAIRDIRPKPALTLIPITPERLAEKEKNHDHFFRTVIEEGVLVATED